MQVLQKDKVIYYPYEYKDEPELQKLVEENHEFIFGEESVYIPGRRIGVPRGESGAKGIPDGFLLLLDRKEWMIVEVELSSHSLHDHIIAQVSRFSQAWKKGDSQRNLIDAYFKYYKESHAVADRFERFGHKDEIYRFITEVISKDPKLVIIIDAITPDVKDAISSISYPTECIEFKTFQREGVTDLVPIFQYEKLSRVPLRPPITETKGEKMLRFLGRKVPFKYSKEIPVIVANELIKMGQLTKEIIPWGPGKKRYIVSQEPRHPSGKDFFAPVQLDNGWWVETHAGMESNRSYASRLIKECGIKDNDVRIE